MQTQSRFGFGRFAPMLAAAPLFASFSANLYDEHLQGADTVYRYVWWLGPAAAVGGVLSLLLGIVLIRRFTRLGVMAMVMSPVLIVFVAPGVWQQRVIVGDDHFEARYGFWWNPTVQNLRYDDFREMRYLEKQESKKSRTRMLMCYSKAGTGTIVYGGDLTAQAVPQILTKAKEHGVKVENFVTQPAPSAT